LSEKNTSDIDQKIISVSKSTRTSLAMMTPLHNILRGKYNWYHMWHLKPFASTLHWVLLTAFLVGGITGISIYYSVQGKWASAQIDDMSNTPPVHQEVFALSDPNAKPSNRTSGESAGTNSISDVSSGQNIGLPDTPTENPPFLPGVPSAANPPATEPPPQEPEESEIIVEWDIIVSDLEIFIKTANNATGKVKKFELNNASVSQQNVENLFVFLVENKKDLITTLNRDKKILGVLDDYSSEKKALSLDTGKQTLFIDLLKDESLKGIEVGVKKKTTDKPIKEIL